MYRYLRRSHPEVETKLVRWFPQEASASECDDFFYSTFAQQIAESFVARVTANTKNELVSYAQIANSLARPKASRAVGTAVGANPITCVVHCHRVIQQRGRIGGYR